MRIQTQTHTIVHICVNTDLFYLSSDCIEIFFILSLRPLPPPSSLSPSPPIASACLPSFSPSLALSFSLSPTHTHTLSHAHTLKHTQTPSFSFSLPTLPIVCSLSPLAVCLSFSSAAGRVLRFAASFWKFSGKFVFWYVSVSASMSWSVSVSASVSVSVSVCALRKS